MTSLLTKPQKLIKWANAALDEAHAILQTYFVQSNVSVWEEHDADTGWNYLKAEMGSALPELVEDRLTCALNNTKNSFDQMLFYACRGIGKPIHDGHYPWADSPTALDKWKLQDKSGKERIPREFWDLIRAQQPYKAGEGYEGGHTIERSVATLANGKHSIGLDVAARVGELKFDRIVSNGAEVGVPVPMWNAEKQELTILQWRDGIPTLYDKCHLAFDVCLDSTAPTDLIGCPAIHALRAFAEHAQSCLDGFKARCAELLA